MQTLRNPDRPYTGLWTGRLQQMPPLKCPLLCNLQQEVDSYCATGFPCRKDNVAQQRLARSQQLRKGLQNHCVRVCVCVSLSLSLSLLPGRSLSLSTR